MNTVQLYRAQQLAISAAIDSGQFELASDLLQKDVQSFAQYLPDQSGTTGHKPRRKRKSKLARILCRLLK